MVVEAGVVVLARPADEPDLGLLVAAEAARSGASRCRGAPAPPTPRGGRQAPPRGRAARRGSRNSVMCGPPGGRAAARRCARGSRCRRPRRGRRGRRRAVRAVDERVGPHGGGHRGDRRRAVGRRVVEGVRVPHGGVAAARRQPLGLEGGQAGEHGEADPQPGNAGRAHVRTASHAVCIWATYDVMAGHQAGSPAPEGEGGAHGAGPGCTRSGADRASSRPRSGAHNSMPLGPTAPPRAAPGR